MIHDSELDEVLDMGDEEMDDEEHGLTAEFRIGADPTVMGFITRPESGGGDTPFDATALTDGGLLQFDMRVVSAPNNADASWLFKIESNGAATAVELPLSESVEGQAPVEGECELRFNVGGGALDELIDAIGQAPLPPYILSRRKVDAQDSGDYQTEFAQEGESVAAPTAGLHFSPDMLTALARRGVKNERLRLDVNAGTFRPVKAERLSGHKMHAERAMLSQDSADAINAVRRSGGRCIAVGTTSMRTLESAGVDGELRSFDRDTDIFIRPGFEFRICDGLLTNFHLPRSTLFVLVSAFMGLEVMRRAYQHASDKRYRFFSYGDACLLLPNG